MAFQRFHQNVYAENSSSMSVLIFLVVFLFHFPLVSIVFVCVCFCQLSWPYWNHSHLEIRICEQLILVVLQSIFHFKMNLCELLLFVKGTWNFLS